MAEKNGSTKREYISFKEAYGSAILVFYNTSLLTDP
jgi:hypothetical protein